MGAEYGKVGFPPQRSQITGGALEDPGIGCPWPKSDADATRAATKSQTADLIGNFTEDAPPTGLYGDIAKLDRRLCHSTIPPRQRQSYFREMKADRNQRAVNKKKWAGLRRPTRIACFPDAFYYGRAGVKFAAGRMAVSESAAAVARAGVQPFSS